MQETFNPSRAAKQIGVPGSTLRLWAKTYAEFLSEGANPPTGEERRFTVADVETLKAVNQLRHNGMLPADIAQRLRNNLAGSPQSPPEQSTAPLAVPAAPHDAIQAFLQRTDIDDRLRDVDRRLERMEHSRSLLIAFAAGAVTVVAVAVLVWLLTMVR